MTQFGILKKEKQNLGSLSLTKKIEYLTF